MSAPRTKRQFAGAASDPAQRQITSFFNSASSSSSPASISIDPNLRTSDPRNPLLPDSVQANLISVGMRVRKSVPEGYKTGTYRAFALWDEANSGASTTTPTTTTSATAMMGEGRSRANAISTPRELLPFCGIHKVGGLGTQSQIPTTDANTLSSYQPLVSVNGGLPLDDAMMNDDVPGLTSSQETVESTDSDPRTPLRTRKRSYTEDEDDVQMPTTPDRLNVNVNAWRNINTTSFDFDGEVSPRSLGPAGWSPGNGRLMAVPRKGKLRGSKLAAGLNGDQENVMVMGADGGDFGEADFLDNPRDWEVEMRDA
ncbi:ribonucleotide reductase inhibitor-domain-containing protein [Hypoxylon rubiginosum]|uniref:Ribonucleotide reductase inhibitor-domain-containing protein n=1 Tax=Hypoxylon rubiginosum TaxID=110542 RepID=A0ACC0D8Q9_9PEZI|nr:ribonucleotide reductase inhibitor-domain-containing protein [Hypoxylon rubiginosum]